MLLAIILIALIAFGGLALTYLFAEDEPVLWRISAGIIVGSAIFGTIGFGIALLFGLTTATILISLAFTICPLMLLRRKDPRERLRRDWRKAKDKLQGKSLRRAAPFFYYAFFFLLFLFFFERTMYETAQGIFTGGSQNPPQPSVIEKPSSR